MLSTGDDALEGTQAITRRGSLVIVQVPGTCLCKIAPEEVLEKLDGHPVIVTDTEMAGWINSCFFE